jgi:hypothetical protein
MAPRATRRPLLDWLETRRNHCADALSPQHLALAVDLESRSIAVSS